MGATLWLAHTRYQYGRMLQARGGSAERARAGQLLALAADTAATHGLHALAAALERLSPATRERPRLPDDLSPREALVLRLVARGLSNREIGHALAISEHTVANHIRSILRKTRCANRTEATAYAYRHGLAEQEAAS
jgi:DNA-binding NarL/FixJ family response regulator